ncbi:GatB/YqeY domain-containing protein [Thermaurantiacus sp.]
MIRSRISEALTAAMKARDLDRVAALRLVQAALKNRDIEARTGNTPGDDDRLVVEVLQKMAKQRRESIEMYEKGGRDDLAARERFELGVIEAFLPAQLDEAEARDAIAAIAARIGATGIKDMGALMAAVKAELSGRVDMGRASRLAKAVLEA